MFADRIVIAVKNNIRANSKLNINKSRTYKRSIQENASYSAIMKILSDSVDTNSKEDAYYYNHVVSEVNKTYLSINSIKFRS